MGGCPGWLLLAGTKHQVHTQHDLEMMRTMYNKYKKCKKYDAFKHAVDTLFFSNSFKVKSPQTYVKDMTSIKDTFEQVGDFPCVHFRCVQLCMRAALHACSFACVHLCMSAALHACSFACKALHAFVIFVV